MPLTEIQRLARLRARLRELRLWLDRDAIDLADWTFNGRPLAVGERWPSRDGVVLITHPIATLPEEWAPDECRLELELGGEGLLRVLYQAGGSEEWGLDPQHRQIPLRSNSFSLSAEVVARLPFGVPNRTARLERARLVWWDTELDHYLRLMGMSAEVAGVLGTHDAVESLLLVAERSLSALDWPSDTGAYLARIAPSNEQQEIWAPPPGLERRPPGLSDEARRRVSQATADLRGELQRLQQDFPQRGSVALTGHAHLDLAWLWPLEETRRKARRSYATEIGLMERYPELRFNQSSAQIYAFIEEDDPDLFERIRERVRLGQWEPVGGMWVEPDINMTCGESLVRQLLYGQRYFQQRFGALHTVCWLPDCFGFSPALPQLLRGAGIENFFTIKVTWSETNPFPYDLFWWEGLDGSRVLAHIFDNPSDDETATGGYNGDSGPFAAVHTWRLFKGKHLSGETLLSAGFGDGGGGVTFEMMERARVMEILPAVPAVHFDSVSAFYERTRERIAGARVPVWLGEMYLELHRGTLTTQGRTKWLHRRAERDLVAAEAATTLAYLLGSREPQSLEPLWRVLLRNQFHDILPGSSIREVYEQAEQELTEVTERAGQFIQCGLDRIGEQHVTPGAPASLLIFNPDVSRRPVRLQLETRYPGAQAVDGGSVLSTAEHIDGLAAVISNDVQPFPDLEVGVDRLENAFVRVQVAEDGTITSLYHKASGREALSATGNQLWVYVDKPPTWDAWDIDAGVMEHGEQLRASSLEVVEQGPHRGALCAVYRFRDSTITQCIRLWANSPRLEFKTEIDWHDRRWLLKTRFFLNVRADRATFETAYGIVQRPTHRNTSWDAARFEVAGHRFADLSEPGFGVALLNDGKYGHHALDNELGLSMLRSPVYPDPLADEGQQSFTYAVLPHAGDWFEGGCLMEAEDLNRPLVTRSVTSGQPEVIQPLRLHGLPVGLGALKIAEDGRDVILRVYEPQGARGEVQVTVLPGWELASHVDLLERDTGVPDKYLTPFQVRSWRLRRVSGGAP